MASSSAPGGPEVEESENLPPESEEVPYTGTHQLDAVIEPLLRQRGVVLENAPELEICRRLMTDLLGRLPTLEQMESECVGRDLYGTIRRLQQTERYLLVSERYWRDRLVLSDYLEDSVQLKALFTDVRLLHSRYIRYDDFAVRLFARPKRAFTSASARIFWSFFGRVATKTERDALEPLFGFWDFDFSREPDVSGVYRFEARVDPEGCLELGGCSTSLFGGIDLDALLPPGRIPYPELSDSHLEAFQEALRPIANNPSFWDAAAGLLLERFLRWDDGQRQKRRVGDEFPKVQQWLADFLRQTGDLVAAEALVLSSWLYRLPRYSGPERAVDDPVYAFGPTKPVTAEILADTAAIFANRDFGTCDPRYPENYYYTKVMEYSLPDQLNQNLADLWALLEPRLPLVALGDELRMDESYLDLVDRLGGCYGSDPVFSVSSGFDHERLVDEVCRSEKITIPIDPESTPEEVIDLLTRSWLGRRATASEKEAAAALLISDDGADIGMKNLTRGLCRAVLGSAELYFY